MREELGDLFGIVLRTQKPKRGLIDLQDGVVHGHRIEIEVLPAGLRGDFREQRVIRTGVRRDRIDWQLDRRRQCRGRGSTNRP